MKPRAIAAAVFFASFGALIFGVHAAETDALQFVNPDLHLGAITNDQDVSVTFVLTNRSDKVVKIVSADTSCHCTWVLKAPAEIPVAKTN